MVFLHVFQFVLHQDYLAPHPACWRTLLDLTYGKVGEQCLSSLRTIRSSVKE